MQERFPVNSNLKALRNQNDNGELLYNKTQFLLSLNLGYFKFLFVADQGQSENLCNNHPYNLLNFHLNEVLAKRELLEAYN